MRLIILSLAFSVVLIGGCREALTDPSKFDIPTPEPSPTADVAPLYVKGPGVLANGTAGNFRAEFIHDPELETYEWKVFGEGDMTVVPNDPDGISRLVQGVPTRTGEILLTVRARSHDGQMLAYGEKLILLE